VHVVAEAIEDLTHLLRRLAEDAVPESCVALAAARSAPAPRPQRHPRAGDALVTAFRDGAAAVRELGFDVVSDQAVSEVMPKGRNFH